MSDIPSWKGFRISKIPTTNPNTPKQEVGEKEQTLCVEVCKICRKPLAENYIVCSRCGQYVCENHSMIYQMASHCYLCIAELTGVDKRGFKVLYGFVHEYSKKKIKEAGKFTDAELENVLSKLATAGMIEHKKLLFGLFEKIEATSLALETMPVLESIYSPELERDVSEFIVRLDQNNGLLGNIIFNIKPSMIIIGLLIGIVAYVSARSLNGNVSIVSLMSIFGFLIILTWAVRKRGGNI